MILITFTTEIVTLNMNDVAFKKQNKTLYNSKVKALRSFFIDVPQQTH